MQPPKLGAQAEGLNFNIYFVLITLGAPLIYKQPPPLQTLLQMFVLAISSPISKAVGIHQHSNNVTWHRKKPFATIRSRGGGEKRESICCVFFFFPFFSFILLSDGASGVSFWGDSKTNRLRGLQSFSGSPSETSPPCSVSIAIPHHTTLAVKITPQTIHFIISVSRSLAVLSGKCRPVWYVESGVELFQAMFGTEEQDKEGTHVSLNHDSSAMSAWPRLMFKRKGNARLHLSSHPPQQFFWRNRAPAGVASASAATPLWNLLVLIFQRDNQRRDRRQEVRKTYSCQRDFFFLSASSSQRGGGASHDWRLITNIKNTSSWKSRWEADFHGATLQ